LASVGILLLISDDLAHRQVIPTSGDIPIFWLAFGTLTLTFLAYLWNVLGWLGSREGVRVAQLNAVVKWATLFFSLDAIVGGSVLLGWALGSAGIPTTWQRDAGLGAVASFFLAALPMLRLANRTGFVGDEFDKAVSERPMPLPTRVVWFVYAGGALISLFSALQILSPGYHCRLLRGQPQCAPSLS
jgi:hypothetical protein